MSCGSTSLPETGVIGAFKQLKYMIPGDQDRLSLNDRQPFIVYLGH